MIKAYATNSTKKKSGLEKSTWNSFRSISEPSLLRTLASLPPLTVEDLPQPIMAISRNLETLVTRHPLDLPARLGLGQQEELVITTMGLLTLLLHQDRHLTWERKEPAHLPRILTSTQKRLGVPTIYSSNRHQEVHTTVKCSHFKLQMQINP